MKFANYELKKTGKGYIGDSMQIIATDYLYSLMGIKKEDIIYIETDKLSTYEGEYVILPVTMPCLNYIEGGISKRFSPYIIPCFLCLTLQKNNLLPEEVDYLKRYEPIGCRDEFTMNLLRKYQIQCYLNGCITLTLPDCREEKSENGKVFIVDVEEKLLNSIPSYIRDNAEYRTHNIQDKKVDDYKNEAIRQYDEYKKEAKLVITSLLHCAVPCIAAGIPVIILRPYISHRFSWIDKIVPIYTEMNVDSIDWNIESPEIEDIKKKMTKNNIEKLEKCYNENHLMYDISYFFEDRDAKKQYEYQYDSMYLIMRHVMELLNRYPERKSYSIWGMNEMAEFVIDYIKKNCPQMILKNVYDIRCGINFYGHSSISPDLIEKDELVIVTATAARNAANIKFKEMQKEDYVMIYGNL